MKEDILDYLIRKELEGLPDMTVKSMGVGSAAQTEKSGSENSAEDSRVTWKKHDKKLKFSYKEQREFETIDEEITALEEEERSKFWMPRCWKTPPIL